MQVNEITIDKPGLFRRKRRMYYTPAGWEDCTPEQLRLCIEARETPRDQQQDLNFQVAQLRTNLIRKLAGMSDYDFIGWHYKRFFKKSELMPDPAWVRAWSDDLLSTVDFVFDGSTCSKNLQPSFEFENIKFCGPAHALLNVRGKEMKIADAFYVAYKMTDDPKYLAGLVAAVYRPERPHDPTAHDYDGDPRVPFNAATVDLRWHQFQTLDPLFLLGVLFYFESCKIEEQTSRPEIFEEANGTYDPEGWRKLMHTLASAEFGTVEEVEEAFVPDIYFRLRFIDEARDRITHPKPIPLSDESQPTDDADED